jgi:hexokinase
MSLMQEVKRVAAEFEFTDDDVNRSVKEFIAEMSACPANKDQIHN